MYHAQPVGGAYAKIDDVLLSPKRAEAKAIAGLTRRMIAAFSKDETPFSRRVELLHENRRLWQAVMTSVASDHNELPDGLRVGLINLGAYVERVTTELLGGTGDVRVLIEINRRIVAGLSTEAS
jgi:flagellar protein FlaF